MIGAPNGNGQITVAGGKELAAALKELPNRIAKHALQNAVIAGANEIRDEARRLYPGKTGKAGIVARRSKAKHSDEKSARVRASGSRWYLRLIEFGRSAFKVNVRNKKALASGGEVFGRSAEIPAMPARPFLRPAFETKKVAAVKRMGEVLAANIRHAARELAAGASRIRFNSRRVP